MPITIIPKDVNEPSRREEADAPEAGSGTGEAQPAAMRGSRWIDYETHELLEMISELEDERRFARLREGILWAVLFHIFLISALTWIPKYVLRLPTVLDPINEIQKRKDLTYLDELPDALREIKPKVVIQPVAPKQTRVDKNTLEALNRTPPPPRPVMQPSAPPTPAPAMTPAPAPTPPSTPAPQPVAPNQPSSVQTPRPAAVPARPNFAMNSENPSDQLREAMRNSAQKQGAGGSGGNLGPGSLARHPGAGTGGVEILSDTQNVDFRNWIQRWHRETENTWDPLIPDEVNPPILKSGMVVIRFKVLPNGRLMEPNGVILEGRSGDTALDRAAWGALTGSNYPPLPSDFHGPYLELRAYFLYNMQVPK